MAILIYPCLDVESNPVVVNQYPDLGLSLSQNNRFYVSQVTVYIYLQATYPVPH